MGFEWQAGKALALTAGASALSRHEERYMLAIRTQPIDGESLLLQSGVARKQQHSRLGKGKFPAVPLGEK